MKKIPWVEKREKAVESVPSWLVFAKNYPFVLPLLNFKKERLDSNFFLNVRLTNMIKRNERNRIVKKRKKEKEQRVGERLRLRMRERERERYI